ADGRAGEAKLADGRVDHAFRSELREETERVPVGPAALAGALAQVDDARIAPHLDAEGVDHRFEGGHLAHAHAGAPCAPTGASVRAKTCSITVAGSGQGALFASST